jgi:acyl-CoA thioesterase YciA
MRQTGEATTKAIAMPADTNPNGDIFGGWLLSQMDLAGWALATKLSQGRATTVALKAMTFIHPVKVGDVVSCFTRFVESGTTSLTLEIEAWINIGDINKEKLVTSGTFVFVAIDEYGLKRRLGPSIAHQKLQLDSPNQVAAVIDETCVTNNYYFLTQSLLGLAMSGLILLIGTMATAGIFAIPSVIAAPMLGFGAAGCGFFAHQSNSSDSPTSALSSGVSL